MKFRNMQPAGFPQDGTRVIGYAEDAQPRLNGHTVSSVLSNGTRASIIYLLANSPDTLYSMQVQEIAAATKTAQRMVIYHLERLRKMGLVEVKKSRKYGRKERRSIWGLDMRNSELVGRCCELLEDFLGKRELAVLTSSRMPVSRRARASKASKLARSRAMFARPRAML